MYPGGHWPRKGVWGCAALKTPLFPASPAVRKGPISSKRVSSQDPLLRKFGNFSLYSLNFCPNFSSQAPKFGNFQLTSPLIGKFFSSQAPKFGNFQFTSPPPPFSEASISLQAPHSEIRAAHPYLRVVTSQNLVPAKFYKNLIQSTELKALMPITFSSPRAQPEVVYFLVSNESPYFSNCKSEISPSNSL